MKKFSSNLLIFVLTINPCILFAQSNNEIIKNIQEHMLENYIFLDKAVETNEHLDRLMEQGFFDHLTDSKEFAKALSVEMQKITKDKHLNVAPPRQPRTARPGQEVSDFISRHLDNLVRFRDGGFGELNLLDGNVAYVELKGFRREDISKVDDVMHYFSTADAIIIDLRNNGGGSHLGLYWSSYFFEVGTSLTGSYERRTDKSTEYKTGPVKGAQRLEMPIFILTSNRTFSAAEAFAYDLQSRNRAVIIGEETGGGAHPVDFVRLPKDYGLIVPYARSINPITNANWEGSGVLPDIKMGQEEALEKAKELAIVAAKNYREAPFNDLKTILLKTKTTQSDEMNAVKLFEKILNRKHLEDFMIIAMGNYYFENKQLNAAFVIFKSNATIFPNSINAQDVFADFLAQVGKKEEAIIHYSLAIDLVEKANDPQLEILKKKLMDFKAKL
jgi:hypothetical protein